MRGAKVLRRARPGIGLSCQAPASALAQRAQKITQGDCARITGDELQQQAGRVVFGILRQIYGGRAGSVAPRAGEQYYSVTTLPVARVTQARRLRKPPVCCGAIATLSTF